MNFPPYFIAGLTQQLPCSSMRSAVLLQRQHHLPGNYPRMRQKALLHSRLNLVFRADMPKQQRGIGIVKFKIGRRFAGISIGITIKAAVGTGIVSPYIVTFYTMAALTAAFMF